MKGIGVRLLIVAVIAVGAFVLRDRLPGNAGSLQVGDCFDAPTAHGVEVGDVPHHPCGEPHTGEVVLVRDYEAASDTYPGDLDWLAFVDTHCIPAFNAYTGLDFASELALDIGFFTPTQESWRSGDRRVSCYVTRVDGATMSASVKAAP